jgi:ubiquinone/menaquinone biosynthesis C-methylase UbiE
LLRLAYQAQDRSLPRICDYEGSQYRTEFWKSQDRRYEDAVERIALRKLLPPRGERLIEIGAGFGRLADLYAGYEQVVLLDYARTQLEEAQTYLGRDRRFIYVVADVYRLPFVDRLFDSLTMIRVMHHLVDVAAALSEIQRIIVPGGVAVIEYASKLHMKALARWLLGRQTWTPFDRAPLEFVELNYNFHPAWMHQQFERAGLQISNTRTVSHYRIGWLKRMVPTAILVALDSWAQPTGNWWQLTPSVFLQARAQKNGRSSGNGLFCCPACKSPDLSQTELSGASGRALVCQQCQRGWSLKDGIYDFKTPLNQSPESKT